MEDAERAGWNNFAEKEHMNPKKASFTREMATAVKIALSYSCMKESRYTAHTTSHTHTLADALL